MTIADLVDRFLRQSQPTIVVARELETALDDAYPYDDFVAETVEMLAMYRPEGGDYLFDVEPVKARLRLLLQHLNVIDASPR